MHTMQCCKCVFVSGCLFVRVLLASCVRLQATLMLCFGSCHGVHPASGHLKVSQSVTNVLSHWKSRKPNPQQVPQALLRSEVIFCVKADRRFFQFFAGAAPFWTFSVCSFQAEIAKHSSWMREIKCLCKCSLTNSMIKIDSWWLM